MHAVMKALQNVIAVGVVTGKMENAAYVFCCADSQIACNRYANQCM